MNRRISVCLLAALLAAGTFLCRQTDSLAGSADKSKDSPTSLQDTRLIRNNEEAKQLRQQVEAASKRAFEHGYHACCINPPCSWCLLHLGQCSCAMGVGSGRYACRECHGGWEANQGRIPGKTRNDVRKMKTIGTDFMGELSGQTGQAEERQVPGPSGAEGSAPGTSGQAVSIGAKLYNSNNCQSCHKMNGQGGDAGPDLTHEAQRHSDAAWQIEHLKAPQKVHPGSTMPSYASLPPDQLSALASYLVSLK
ncbi:MAG TPA: c-type cytochrome [Chthonomonadaceae bacterium]|nr:c-type cytochrome [Chthonomonadaceae bacterium]